MLNQYSLINIVGTQIFDCLTVNTTINELNYDDDEEPLYLRSLLEKLRKGKTLSCLMAVQPLSAKREEVVAVWSELNEHRLTISFNSIQFNSIQFNSIHSNKSIGL